MKNRKNKYSKLERKADTLDFNSKASLILRFKEPTGRWQIIDLSFFENSKFPRFNLGQEIAYAVKKIFPELAVGTRDQLSRVIKNFNDFLDWKASGEFPSIDSLSDISFDLLLEYQAYLELFTTNKNAENSYGYISRFIHKISLKMPNFLSEDLQLPTNKFVSNRKIPKSKSNVISLDNLKNIYDAALNEYKQIRENHKKALKLLKQSEHLSVIPVTPKKNLQKTHIRRPWGKNGYILHHLIREVGITGAVPGATINAILKNKFPKATTQLGWYIPNSDKCLLPILILLYIKTGINVTSMHTLKRDCLFEHPLPLNLMILRFTKPRSGSAINKELSFPAKQKDGVVDLINFLLEYTKPLVEFAVPEEKNYLFLYVNYLKVKSAVERQLEFRSSDN